MKIIIRNVQFDTEEFSFSSPEIIFETDNDKEGKAIAKILQSTEESVSIENQVQKVLHGEGMKIVMESMIERTVKKAVAELPPPGINIHEVINATKKEQ